MKLETVHEQTHGDYSDTVNCRCHINLRKTDMAFNFLPSFDIFLINTILELKTLCCVPLAVLKVMLSHELTDMQA